MNMKGVSKTLGESPLFVDATLSLTEGQIIGIVGSNGAGKSTLLAIIAQRLEPDSGTISLRRGLEVATLEQQIRYSEGATVASFLLEGIGRRVATLNTYTSVLERNHTQEELTAALEAMELHLGWTLEVDYASLLGELGFAGSHDQRMDKLSGGMQKRVALARLFAAKADLLLLDEPTNHLDIPTIEWLQQQLKSSGSTVVAVTHDRLFLDEACDMIAELDGQSLYTHPTPFATFLARREERYAHQAAEAQRITTILRGELAWLKRGAKARTSKDSARTERVEALLSEAESAKSRDTIAPLSSQTRRLGKRILEVHEISKSYGQRTVIKEFTHTFTKGCRIGIIGPNGVGKTTLLDLITQTISVDSGRVEKGVNTVFSYLRQDSALSTEDQTILEAVEEIAKVVTISKDQRIGAARFLTLFGFPTQMHRQSLSSLSGGERRRLALVISLLGDPNFLVLDEPTNDLDLAMLESLEEYLDAFEGCVIVSSHDRAFLDLVCTELFILDGNAKVSYHPGTYSDWREHGVHLSHIPEQVKRQPASKETTRIESSQKRRLSTYEERQLEALQAQIEEYGEKITRLEASFSTIAETADGDITTRTERYHALLAELQTLEEAWLELAERQ